MYVQLMRDHERLGHMRKVARPIDSMHYCPPQTGVLKAASSIMNLFFIKTSNKTLALL